MASDLLDTYREALLARWRATTGVARVEISQPGLYGLLDAPERPSVVMLVTDDRCASRLKDILAAAQAGMIQVFATAPRCLSLLERERGWTGSPSTAMVCPALSRMPRLPLPGAFRVRSVQRTDQDPSDGVPLRDAVDCVVRAAPQEDPDRLSSFLRSLSAKSSRG